MVDKAEKKNNTDHQPVIDTTQSEDSKNPPDQGQHTVSGVLGEIVWLMTQSPSHKRLFVGELEWYVMEPMMLSQFRIYRKEKKPIGVVIWAWVNDEIHQRLKSGNTRLRGKEWHSGEHAWIVDVVSPFGDPSYLVNHLADNVFQDKPYHYLHTDDKGVQKMVTMSAGASAKTETNHRDNHRDNHHDHKTIAPDNPTLH